MIRLAPALLLLAGCTASAYLGEARDFAPEEFQTTPGWIWVPGVPFVAQEKDQDCGAAALAAVLAFWKRPVACADLARECGMTDQGIAAGELKRAAEARGLRAFVIPGTVRDLEHELAAGRPVLVGLVRPTLQGNRTHFEVVAGYHKERALLALLDPSRGWCRYPLDSFEREWGPSGRLAMVAFPP